MSPLANLQREAHAAAVPLGTRADEVLPDRRGPLRPKRLAPSRVRLQGRMVVATFQALDALMVSALAGLLIYEGRGPAPAVVAAAAGVVGCLG